MEGLQQVPQLAVGDVGSSLEHLFAALTRLIAAGCTPDVAAGLLQTYYGSLSSSPAAERSDVASSGARSRDEFSDATSSGVGSARSIRRRRYMERCRSKVLEDGFCYLRAFHVSKRLVVARQIGAYPSLEVFMSLEPTYYDLTSLRRCQFDKVGDLEYHLTDLVAGSVTAYDAIAHTLVVRQYMGRYIRRLFSSALAGYAHALPEAARVGGLPAGDRQFGAPVRAAFPVSTHLSVGSFVYVGEAIPAKALVVVVDDVDAAVARRMYPNNVQVRGLEFSGSVSTKVAVLFDPRGCGFSSLTYELASAWGVVLYMSTSDLAHGGVARLCHSVVDYIGLLPGLGFSVQSAERFSVAYRTCVPGSTVGFCSRCGAVSVSVDSSQAGCMCGVAAVTCDIIGCGFASDDYFVSAWHWHGHHVCMSACDASKRELVRLQGLAAHYR